MLYIHLKRDDLDMYITLRFNETEYEDYMIQASEEARKYFHDGWKLVNVIYRPRS